MSTAYRKTTVQGKTLNNRTAALYYQAVKIFHIIGGKGAVYINQGSYNSGVDASGNTHNGGGAIDTSLEVKTAKNYQLWQKAMRMVMFADWHRAARKGVWPTHNHGIAIGDVEASVAAQKQIVDYFKRLNGLANHAPDPTWRPDVLFKPSYPLGRVSLSGVLSQAKKPLAIKNVTQDVRQVQRALSLKTGVALKVDGIFGAKTQTIYKRWELEIWPAAQREYANGYPDAFTLPLLGAGIFNVDK